MDYRKLFFDSEVIITYYLFTVLIAFALICSFDPNGSLLAK